MSSDTSVRIRRFEPADAAACARVFYDSVHEGAARFYDEQQRRAWAPEPMAADVLSAKLEGQEIWVAEDARGIAGFMSLQLPDYLDFAYVRPDCMGRGIAAQLYELVVLRARREGAPRLTSHASELARRFFERRGWKVDARRDFEHRGVAMHNYAMSLTLHPPDRPADR